MNKLPKKNEKTYKVYAGTILDRDTVIEDFCLIGVPPFDTKEGDLQTKIGAGALIRSHTVIYAGNNIGSNFQTGNKVNIREMNDVGNNVSVGTLSVIEHHVNIAAGVRIHSQVFVPEYSILEEGCWLGPNVVLTNARYPLSPEAKKNLQGPRVGRGAKIGANSTLLPGVVIGQQALVGAGSVVVKDVAPGQVVAGNPARVIKTVADLGVYPPFP